MNIIKFYKANHWFRFLTYTIILSLSILYGLFATTKLIVAIGLLIAIIGFIMLIWMWTE